MTTIYTTSLTVILSATIFGWSNVATAQWVQADYGLPTTEISSIATIGTNVFTEIRETSGTFYGAYSSTDSGNNWTAANTGLLSLHVTKIIAVGTTLYASVGGVNVTDGGIYSSTDNGATWTAMNNGFAYNVGQSIAALGTTLYASMFEGLYVSTDYGSSWTITTDQTILQARIQSVVSSGTNIIACSNEGSTGYKGIFLSTDNGTIWSATSITVKTEALAVIGATVFAATGDGVLKSTDDGVTWTSVTTPTNNATALAVIGTTLIVGTPYGIYSSSDYGATFTDISTGAGASQLSITSFGMDANYIYAGNSSHPVGLWRRPLSDFGVSGVPEAPTNLTLTPQKTQMAGQIELNWTDNSNDEDGFNIERSLDGNSWTIIGTATAATYTDNGLQEATLYYYQVAAYNGSGSSAYSNVVSGMTLTVGIDVVEEISISVYPNPASDFIQVNNSSGANETYMLTIQNCFGQIVLSHQVSGTIATLDISSLAKGIYFFQMDTGTRLYSQKLVVN